MKRPLKTKLRWLFAVVRRGWKSFWFLGKRYYYFVHLYNYTWLNERAVEVPIIWQKIQQKKRLLSTTARILEIGNVLSHYYPVTHTIIDKYETASGVLNHDVVDLPPEPSFDLIVAVSTFEHVGWDETPKDPTKIAKAILACMRALKPGGELLFTIPAGYNTFAVLFCLENNWLFTNLSALQRQNLANQWQQVDPVSVKSCAYNQPFPNANAILVASIVRPSW